MNRTYSISDAAYVLGVNGSTITRWIRTGKLKVEWKKSRYDENELIPCYIIKESDLEECICNHTQQTITMINTYNQRKDRQRQLDYLDARENELYDELCIIQHMKRNISRMDL